MPDIDDCIHRLKALAIVNAQNILAAAANGGADPLPIAKNSDLWRVCTELQTLKKQLKEANTLSHKSAVKWWKRHCDTNKNLDLTKEAHADLCAIEQTTRSASHVS